MAFRYHKPHLFTQNSTQNNLACVRVDGGVPIPVALAIDKGPESVSEDFSPCPRTFFDLHSHLLLRPFVCPHSNRFKLAESRASPSRLFSKEKIRKYIFKVPIRCTGTLGFQRGKHRTLHFHQVFLRPALFHHHWRRNQQIAFTGAASKKTVKAKRNPFMPGFILGSAMSICPSE